KNRDRYRRRNAATRPSRAVDRKKPRAAHASSPPGRVHTGQGEGRREDRRREHRSPDALHRTLVQPDQSERKAIMKITVETNVAAPIEQVGHAYTTPADIKQWNAASDDWLTTTATVDLREGGKFSSRMEAKDGSIGFDFGGTYTKIAKHKLIKHP